DLAGRAVYCIDTPKGLFLVDAPGGAALADHLAKQIKRLGWEKRKLVAVLLTSAGEKATSGLAAVVKSTGCRVVAPKAGLEAVRRRCPAGTELLTEEGLEKAGWLDVRAVPLAGRGVAPVAYRLRWAGKTVLLSGEMPVKPGSPPAFEELRREVKG